MVQRHRVRIFVPLFALCLANPRTGDMEELSKLMVELWPCIDVVHSSRTWDTLRGRASLGSVELPLAC